MKNRYQMILQGLKIGAVISGHILTMLLDHRKVVRRVRPVFYLADCFITTCILATIMLIISP